MTRDEFLKESERVNERAAARGVEMLSILSEMVAEYEGCSDYTLTELIEEARAIVLQILGTEAA